MVNNHAIEFCKHLFQPALHTFSHVTSHCRNSTASEQSLIGYLDRMCIIWADCTDRDRHDCKHIINVSLITDPCDILLFIIYAALNAMCLQTRVIYTHSFQDLNMCKKYIS